MRGAAAKKFYHAADYEVLSLALELEGALLEFGAERE